MAKVKISTEALLLTIASYKHQQEQLSFELKRINEALAALQRDYGKQLKALPTPDAMPGNGSITRRTTRLKSGAANSSTKTRKATPAKSATKLPARVADKQQSIASIRPRKISAQKTGASHGIKSSDSRTRIRNLSDWDQILINALQKSDAPMRKADLDKVFKRHPLTKKLKMSAEDIYLKVARVIHKLANTHKLIQKVNVEGKGYAYTLPA